MGARLLVILLSFALGGCTRVVDAPQPVPVPPVAPITAGQVGDVLSPEVVGGEGNLFVTVEPEECAGIAREVDAPLIFDNDPAAHDGGHWTTDDGQRQVFVEEIAGVYRADFNANDALANAKRAIESCGDQMFTITTMDGDQDDYRLLPQVDSGSPNIVLWSFKADDWACDNAFVAAHNAAFEVTTCSPMNGYDVLTLAHEALERIEKLANTTA
jgi:hypothetical protein